MLFVSTKLNYRAFNLAFLLFIFAPVTSEATIVRIQTSFGVIDVELFDAEAPVTTANFLGYIDNGTYNNTFIHRSLPGLIIQGGGFLADKEADLISPVITGEAIVNEFSANRPNIRGTIAAAKKSDDPNSATSQWFFNLDDNSEELDHQNGGFTVFGAIVGKGLDVVDTISELPIVNTGVLFSSLPTINLSDGNKISIDNLVVLHKFSTNHENFNSSDSDRVFSYLEAFYPEYLSPANPLSPTDAGSIVGDVYYYRHYSSTNSYVGTSNGMLYYLGAASQNQIISLGSLLEWLDEAAFAGY